MIDVGEDYSKNRKTDYKTKADEGYAYNIIVEESSMRLKPLIHNCICKIASLLYFVFIDSCTLQLQQKGNTIADSNLRTQDGMDLCMSMYV